MIGMFNAQTNRDRLATLNSRIAKLEAKFELTEQEQDELDYANESANEIAQWLHDLHRIEG